mmetsp:Transcript_5970/g.20917  ORF Transcript_5970/g.20917 Transcript_5970/m.20917 type:complete len:228 (+) Transcript_5970:145-828(+)
MFTVPPITFDPEASTASGVAMNTNDAPTSAAPPRLTSWPAVRFTVPPPAMSPVRSFAYTCPCKSMSSPATMITLHPLPVHLTSPELLTVALVACTVRSSADTTVAELSVRSCAGASTVRLEALCSVPATVDAAPACCNAKLRYCDAAVPLPTRLPPEASTSRALVSVSCAGVVHSPSTLTSPPNVAAQEDVSCSLLLDDSSALARSKELCCSITRLFPVTSSAMLEA